MTIAENRVEPPPASAANTYLSFLDVVDAPDPIGEVERQLAIWLDEKSWNPPIEESGYVVDSDHGRELLVLHRDHRDGRDFRARLREENSTGVWTTTVTVHGSGTGRPWIGLEVANDANRFVAVPRLVRHLMRAFDVRDGAARLSVAPRLVTVDEVEEFAEELSSPDRQGLFFVAGSDDRLPLGPWREQVGDWTSETTGLASVAVLDPAATAAFVAIMGEHYATSPFTIRTYRPEVDPAVESDARRHRILGTRRLAEDPDRSVRITLGRAARRHAMDRPAPRRFTRLDHELRRIEDRLLLDGLSAGPGPDMAARREQASAPSDLSAAADVYLAQIELVKESLGIPELTPQALDGVARSLSHARATTASVDRLTREMEARRRRLEELQERVEYHQELGEEYELALAEAEDGLARSADENRWLRTQLHRHEDHAAAAASIPADEVSAAPADFAELADWLSEPERLPGVEFTGDQKQVRALDDQDPLGRVARATWMVLLTLSDYVRARTGGVVDGNLKHYLCNTPAGYHGVPPKRYASGESPTTRQAWGAERVFPVPSCVDDSESVVMTAHFKLGALGMVSPRLYFHDDVAGSGTIYVGYIGRHLRNTQTS
ncbi:hypothetical protein [Pseudonocardia phyllosphaerae]|uniref:hypothetical protein n=1 Tax=Pseudonocardia phyllosphaerae TaxID=3390502 RepID=UPI00397E0801